MMETLVGNLLDVRKQDQAINLIEGALDRLRQGDDLVDVGSDLAKSLVDNFSPASTSKLPPGTYITMSDDRPMLTPAIAAAGFAAVFKLGLETSFTGEVPNLQPAFLRALQDASILQKDLSGFSF